MVWRHTQLIEYDLELKILGSDWEKRRCLSKRAAHATQTWLVYIPTKQLLHDHGLEGYRHGAEETYRASLMNNSITQFMNECGFCHVQYETVGESLVGQYDFGL